LREFLIPFNKLTARATCRQRPITRIGIDSRPLSVSRLHHLARFHFLSRRRVGAFSSHQIRQFWRGQLPPESRIFSDESKFCYAIRYLMCLKTVWRLSWSDMYRQFNMRRGQVNSGGQLESISGPCPLAGDTYQILRMGL
jgi:hypothetical protein